MSAAPPPRPLRGRRAALPAGLLGSNLFFLLQGLELLGRIEDERYVALPAPFAPREGGSRGGVGAHFRHILDHYGSFLAGLSGGRVNYDLRGRDRRLESDRRLAIGKIESICAALREREGFASDRPLLVALEAGGPPDDPLGGRGEGEPRAGWSRSSVARELQFLVSHTVHHYAIVAVMLRLLGVEPGRDFGVAPSTLKHERGNAPCAR